MIREANMNPGVLQCKNCWKWGHITFLCRIQGSKCIKYNGPHKSNNYCEFSWCCKANDKLNLPYLETKKGKPCSHISSNVPTVKVTIKQIPIYVHFGRTGSIENDIKRNMLRSVKIGQNQFV